MKNINDFPIQIQIMEFDFIGNEMWIFLSEDMNRIKQKIELYGKRLYSWDIKFYYGILTGANPVFLIDQETKDKLSKDNEEIDKLIVPIYRGKDIDRYSAKFENVFLINTHNGIKNQNINPIRLGNQHQKLIEYFDGFGDKFKNRGEQGENWYNLRNCAYLSVFEQPKIIYADIVQNLGRFYYDEQRYYTNDTAFIIYGKKNLKYLTGVLNSKVTSFAYKYFYAGLSLGEKGLRYKKEFLEKLPIPEPNDNIIKQIEELVDQILRLKKENLSVDTCSLEDIIDDIVYKLYNFTEDEIDIIEQYNNN